MVDTAVEATRSKLERSNLHESVEPLGLSCLCALSDTYCYLTSYLDVELHAANGSMSCASHPRHDINRYVPENIAPRDPEHNLHTCLCRKQQAHIKPLLPHRSRGLRQVPMARSFCGVIWTPICPWLQRKAWGGFLYVHSVCVCVCV